MEVLKISLFVSIVIFFTGCLEKKSPERLVEKQAQCESRYLKNEYVIRWMDGHITHVKNTSYDELLKKYLIPYQDDIDVVNPNVDLSPNFEITTSRDDLDSPVVATWGQQNIDALPVWQQGYIGQGVTVAVIDSGVSMGHRLLRNQIAENTGETGVDKYGRDKAYNNIDDDNNGYVDDVHGYNFASDQPDNIDNSGHGTHVSGIIAALHDGSGYDDQDVQGVAPGVKILPVDFIDATSGGTLVAAVNAIDYVIAMNEKMNVRVINASWGGASCSSLLEKKIEELANYNILFVTAAGNSSQNIDIYKEYPAAYVISNQVTVGSITYFKGMADHSNYGINSVHLFAPGKDILSTVSNTQEEVFSGTSMATPFVAAAAAALWSKKPDAHFSEIKEALLKGTHKDGTYLNATQGRLDLSGAMDSLN